MFQQARALHRQGKFEAAACGYAAVLAVDPAHAGANFGLATLFADRDRADEAITHYRAALAADPEFAEASYGFGRLLARRGDLEAAAARFRQVLDVDPGHIDARFALALTLQRLEQDDAAMAELRTVLAADPDRAMAHYVLGTLLCRKRQDAEAIEHFESALTRRPDYADAMAGEAGALLALGRHAEAIALCRKAIAIKSDFARAISMLCVALAQIGDIAAAVAEARRAVAVASHRPEFCYALAQLAKVQRGDPVIGMLQAMLPRAAALSPHEQCWLYFALAKAYDDIGETDRGFAHLLQGNAIKRRQFGYDEASMLCVMDRMREVFNAGLMAARGNLGDRSALPVFIIGMPRSGTTLVEQVLASHAAVFGAGEQLVLPRAVERLEQRVGALTSPEAVCTIDDADLRRIGTAYVAALQSLAPEARRITDKLPGNFLFAGFIHLILPEARIIHVVRDPVDTCLSCFARLFDGEQRFAYDLGELGRYHRAYQRLMAHWREVLPARVLLDVHYENLVTDFAAEARRIVAHCGLQWDDACLEFHKTARPVHTASVAQVRQPIYRSSVGRRRPPPHLLLPLLQALGVDQAAGETHHTPGSSRRRTRRE